MEGDIRLIRDLPHPPPPEPRDWRGIERHIDRSRHLRADACRTLLVSACRWTWRTLAPKGGRRTAAVLLLAAAGLAVAIASHADSRSAAARVSRVFPAACAVPVAVAPGFLPRAGLAVENRLDGPIRLWLEAREGSGLKRTDLGIVGAREQKVFANVLPAGRNVLNAEAPAGGHFHQLFHVSNHGSGTCSRQYLWRIG